MVSHSSTPNWLWRLDAQHRLIMSFVVIAIAFLLVPHWLLSLTRSLIAWNVGALFELVLAWSVIATAHPRQIRKRAQTQDTNRIIVGLIVISAAVASLFAVTFLLGTSKNLPPGQVGLHVVLSVLTMISSWLLFHTVFTLRYARYYYLDSNSANEQDCAGGLEFPGEEQPDYWDFAYFAFVLGMTFQVSDVSITSRVIRRVALLHGLLSFGFYTVIIALSINIISSLI